MKTSQRNKKSHWFKILYFILSLPPGPTELKSNYSTETKDDILHSEQKKRKKKKEQKYGLEFNFKGEYQIREVFNKIKS